MSRYSKVTWSEGLFLRQHHFQQADRYVEHLLENRTRHISPYPWGFSELVIDTDLAERNQFGLRRASGILPDGTPFDMPGSMPLPEAIEVPDGAEKQTLWLAVPTETGGIREIDMAEARSGSRYVRDLETVVDSASAMHVEQEIEIANLRAALEIRTAPRPGFQSLKIARVLEVRDKTITLDPAFAPAVLVTMAHATVSGWLDRVIGWVDTKLDSLARYAADPGSGGGLQALDYFMLQALNRQVNVLKHMRRSKFVHPSEFYRELLRLSGELWTLSPSRRAPDYAAYDHDNLTETFEPVLADIQRLLSLDLARAVHLELIQRGQSAYVAAVTDRALFRNATFIIEVSAGMPPPLIQAQFPELCKVGPGTRMNEIVQNNLPGVRLVHMPTPPRQIRTIARNVYFYLDRSSNLWSEFSQASSLGLHFAGDWPDLTLDLWAIQEERQ